MLIRDSDVHTLKLIDRPVHDRPVLVSGAIEEECFKAEVRGSVRVVKYYRDLNVRNLFLLLLNLW